MRTGGNLYSMALVAWIMTMTCGILNCSDSLHSNVSTSNMARNVRLNCSVKTNAVINWGIVTSFGLPAPSPEPPFSFKFLTSFFYINPSELGLSSKTQRMHICRSTTARVFPTYSQKGTNVCRSH